MSRASLGAAGWGRRLSIADEEGFCAGRARQTRERDKICLEKDERRMDVQTDREVLYHILFVLTSQEI